MWQWQPVIPPELDPRWRDRRKDADWPFHFRDVPCRLFRCTDGTCTSTLHKIKAAIEKISPLPIKYVINTHFHGDHTGGNAAFHKDGATIVGRTTSASASSRVAPMG